MDTKPHLEFRSKQPRATVSTADIWHTTFLGEIAIQAWQDAMLWEEFLNQTKGVKLLVELGTFDGGFSLFLKFQCIGRGLRFFTVDREEFVDFDRSSVANMGLKGNFIKTDIFNGTVIADIIKDPANHPMILFCDNGDKPREMKTFIPLLRSGDYAVTHDWNNEINQDDIGDLPLATMLIPECEELHSLTRFFQRV